MNRHLLLAITALAPLACSDPTESSETDAPPPTTAPTSLTSTTTTGDEETTSDATTGDSTTDDATTEAPSSSSTSATTGDAATYCLDDSVTCEPAHRDWCSEFAALADAHVPAAYADMLDHRCAGGQEPCSLCWELGNICSQVGDDCEDLDLTCGCLGAAHGVLP